MTSLTYAVITAARDEAANLPVLAECLRRQRRRPERWIVVDNSSTDGTPEVARSLAGPLLQVEVAAVPGGPAPQRGGPVVRAFHAGVAALDGAADVVVKVDADITFEDDYFDRLLAAFESDPSLGIASGSLWDEKNGVWGQRHVTADHVWGPSRAYRRECLEQVLPLEERKGWDLIDESKAHIDGWRTRTIVELPFRHHRLEGRRDGSRFRHWASLGRSCYFHAYRPSYLLLRTLYRMCDEPASIAMAWGYLAAAVRREPRCDPAVREHIRAQQSLRRVPRRVREALGRRASAVTRPESAGGKS